MKKLKVGIILLVVFLALTLFTLRLTGLEPQYLDLDQLQAHHMIARPGRGSAASSSPLLSRIGHSLIPSHIPGEG